MPDPRCFLYSSDCREGRIFRGAEAIAAAKESGWVDTPAAVTDAKAPAPKKAASGGKKKATVDDDSQ